MLEVLRLKSDVLKIIREFFHSLGYIEVETPVLVPYENPDDNVRNIRLAFSDFQGKVHEWYLHTSPEFFMKRLVWKGIGKCFQICKVFRDGEVSDHHNVEFTMVEWYREGANFKAGMEETEELVKLVFSKLGVEFASFRGIRASVRVPFERISVDDAFREFAGISNLNDEDELIGKSGMENYEDAFFKLLVESVEPSLAKLGCAFLYGYPEKFSAMAKVKGKRAERFELYICGLEVANGYSELTSYEDYLYKFKLKGESAVDYGFLNLLRVSDLPETEGVSLGLDRLLMLLTGRDINFVNPFSFRNFLDSRI